MIKHVRKYLLVFLILLLVVPLSGCQLPGLPAEQGNKGTIKITALNTTESQIIANIISQLIEHDTNLKTTVVNNLGSSPLEHQALLRKNADIEAAAYSGDQLTTVLGLPASKDPKVASNTVRKQLKKRYDQTYMPSFGFSDTYSFMVKPSTAKKYGLNNVSDLKKVENNFSLGTAADWPNRKGDGYRDFSRDYGITFNTIRPMNIGLVYSALQKGEMDTVLGYSTDGRIDSYHLKLLNDDKHFFPPYNSSMVVNNYVLREHPQLKPVLHKLDGKIGIHQMRSMNYQVDNELLEPSVVAHQFLAQNNYFEK